MGGIGVPLLAAVLLCYIGALVSAFASSVGITGALIPLAVPFLERGEIGAVGMGAAPDVDRERFFRELMVYGGIVVAVVPAAAWLVMVVPGWGQPHKPRTTVRTSQGDAARDPSLPRPDRHPG